MSDNPENGEDGESVRKVNLDEIDEDRLQRVSGDRPGEDADASEIAEWMDGSFSDSFAEGMEEQVEEKGEGFMGASGEGENGEGDS